MKRYQITNSVAFAQEYAASMNLTVSESRSIVSIALTGNGSLKLSDDAKPSVGDEIILKVSSDATARNLTFGDGFTAPALDGVISKTKVQHFVYDGSSFIATGSAIQID